MSQQKKVSCITILFGSLLVFMLALPSLNNLSYEQTTATTTSLPDPNRLIVMVNIERIRNQILLTERSLVAVGDNDMAFAHSYIPHSAIFPSIKSQLNDINSKSALRLESLLTDLPIILKTSEEADSKGKIKNDLTEIEELLDNISNQSIGKDLLSNKTMIAHTIVFLLRDAGK